MKCLCKIHFAFVALLLMPSVHLSPNFEDVQDYYEYSEQNEFNESAEEISDEEMFPELYCQARLVVDQKLMDFKESEVKNFFSFLHSFYLVNCGSLLNRYTDKLHRKLRDRLLYMGHHGTRLDCIFDNILKLGYDRMHFKYNTLIYLERHKKNLVDTALMKEKLKKEIAAQIESMFIKTVDLCWHVEPTEQ